MVSLVPRVIAWPSVRFFAVPTVARAGNAGTPKATVPSRTWSVDEPVSDHAG